MKIRLIKDDSGERDGYWWGDPKELCKVFVPRECVEAIQRAADRRAARIVRDLVPLGGYSADDIALHILHRPKARAEGGGET